MNTDNERVVRRFFEELWNDGDVDVADAVVAPHHVHHVGGRDHHGPAAVQEMVVEFRAAFPDLHFALEDVVSDGDKVVVRWVATGTHDGEFYGLSATGRRVRWTGMDLVRLDGDRIVELWAEADGGALWDRLTDPE